MCHTKSNPILQRLEGREIILGSRSPRRITLLQEIGIEVTIHPADIEEVYDPQMDPYEVPVYLSQMKNKALQTLHHEKSLIITADTIVLLNNEVIGKPADQEEAKAILHKLSGQTHTVVTGYTLSDRHHQMSNSEISHISFRELRDEEIDYYVSHQEVLDKAGAYGVQDWIGLIGVSSIEGSYHNIMGLPTAKLISDLLSFVRQTR